MRAALIVNHQAGSLAGLTEPRATLASALNSSGFNIALEKTVAQMPDDKSAAVRKEVQAEFDKQRGLMVESCGTVLVALASCRAALSPRAS